MCTQPCALSVCGLPRQQFVWQEAEAAKVLPPGPKRPLNAYMIFSAETRAEVKAENPSMQATEVAKLLGEMWSGMSVEDRCVWMGKAGAEKLKYDEQIAAYMKEHGCLPPSGT